MAGLVGLAVGRRELFFLLGDGLGAERVGVKYWTRRGFQKIQNISGQGPYPCRITSLRETPYINHHYLVYIVSMRSISFGF